MFREIKIFDFPPIKTDNDILFFRVEVTHDNNQYYGQLLRRETYHFRPAYAAEEVMADEEIYVRDCHTIPSFGQQAFGSSDECLNHAYDHLQEFFNQKNHQ